MNHLYFYQLIILILLDKLSYNIIEGVQSLVIFPGSKNIPKYDDKYFSEYPVSQKTYFTTELTIDHFNNRRSDKLNIQEKNFPKNLNQNNNSAEEKSENFINENLSYNQSFNELPYDFSKTESIHRVSDLLKFLGIDEKKDDDALVVRKSTDDPVQVGCHSELRTIDLATELKRNNEDIKIFPECIKAKRCAGCCGFNTKKTCTPVKIEKLNVYAAVIRVKRSCNDDNCISEIDRNNFRKMFQVESHEECACKCKTNANDCSLLQEWDEDSCKCICGDNELKKKDCERSHYKIWREKKCQCECKRILKCSTGLLFSQKTCSCVRKSSNQL